MPYSSESSRQLSLLSSSSVKLSNGRFGIAILTPISIYLLNCMQYQLYKNIEIFESYLSKNKEINAK